MKKYFAIAISLMMILAMSANAQMGRQQGRMDDDDRPRRGMMMRGEMMQNDGMGQCGMMMGHNMMSRSMKMLNSLPYMEDKLDLTEQQTDKLIDIQTEFKKRQIDHKASMKKCGMKMRNLMKNNASAEDVKAQMESCSNIMVNMGTEMYRTMQSMRSVLTADQREKLDKMKDDIDDRPRRMRFYDDDD
ncbi:MAG: Spy/CpxP family protein refolding chaperone [Candidatus Kapaibacterium sp.]